MFVLAAAGEFYILNKSDEIKWTVFVKLSSVKVTPASCLFNNMQNADLLRYSLVHNGALSSTVPVGYDDRAMQHDATDVVATR
ncbi:UNVERIFIED_CONTAM: hypothetical protein FKN15_058936 [Acipenser sinensis]